jgi:hypothetical protein
MVELATLIVGFSTTPRRGSAHRRPNRGRMLGSGE